MEQLHIQIEPKTPGKSKTESEQIAKLVRHLEDLGWDVKGWSKDAPSPPPPVSYPVPVPYPVPQPHQPWYPYWRHQIPGTGTLVQTGGQQGQIWNDSTNA